jgi:hypothetical protein
MHGVIVLPITKLEKPLISYNGDLMDDLPNRFPIQAHESTGVDCGGCIVPVLQGNDVELRCNECGAVVGVLQIAILDDLVSMIPSPAFKAGTAIEWVGVASVLEAIEVGDFRRLPGGIYTTSYIRQYARAIDYPEDDILEVYRRHVAGEAVASRPARNEKVPGGFRPASTPASS